MKYARVDNDMVAEVVDLGDLSPSACFHETIASQFKVATEAVEAGWQYKDGEYLEPVTPSPASLVELKTEMKLKIDKNAEDERLKYITPGTGQAMTYQQKVVEAQALKAATNPKPTDYPLLLSEVGITAQTINEVADVVLAAFAQWQQIGAEIEAIRLGAKRNIDAAEDETAARSVIDAIVWSLTE